MNNLIVQLRGMKSNNPAFPDLLSKLLDCDDLSVEEQREVLLLAERMIKGDEEVIKRKELVNHE